MARIEFTLKDIKQFLKQEYKLDWNGQIKTTDNQQNQLAKIEDFKNGVVELMLTQKDNNVYRRALIDWNIFELQGKDGDFTLRDNRSGVWQEMLYKNYSPAKIINSKNVTLSETTEGVKEFLQNEYNCTWVGYMLYDSNTGKCRKINRLDLQDEQGVELILSKNNQICKKLVVIKDLIDDDRFKGYIDKKRKDFSKLFTF